MRAPLFGVTSPFGFFEDHESVPVDLASSTQASWVSSPGPDALVLGRVSHPSRARELAALLRATTPPAKLDAASAATYAFQISARASAEDRDARLDLAVLRARPGGLDGFLSGSCAVWSVGDPLARITASEPAGGVPGFGRAFEANGDLFAIALPAPPSELDAADFAPLKDAYPQHLLLRLASAAIRRAGAGTSEGPVAIWETAAVPLNRPRLHTTTDPKDTALGVATSWVELCDPRRRILPLTVPDLVARAGEDEGMKEYRDLSFVGAAHSMAILALFGGEAIVRRAAEENTARFKKFLRPLAGKPRTVSSVEAVSALTYALEARCAGRPQDGELDAAPWIRALAKDRYACDTAGTKLAFLALAHALPDLADALIGAGKKVKFEPGQQFGFNTQGFVQYLGAALRSKAGAEAIAPAWNEHLRAFAHKLAARTLEWSDLIIAAFVVHARIGGLPEATVVARLHQEVRALAAPQR